MYISLVIYYIGALKFSCEQLQLITGVSGFLYLALFPEGRTFLPFVIHMYAYNNILKYFWH